MGIGLYLPADRYTIEDAQETEFNEELWYSTVDHVMVYEDK